MPMARIESSATARARRRVILEAGAYRGRDAAAGGASNGSTMAPPGSTASPMVRGDLLASMPLDRKIEERVMPNDRDGTRAEYGRSLSAASECPPRVRGEPR